LDGLEQEMLDRIRQRFRYHREAGQVTEGAVNAIVVSRLLEMAGFYDPPFRLRSEVSVDIETVDQDETLRGRIDFLVIQGQFWRAVIESKETEFDVEVGIPQLLVQPSCTRLHQIEFQQLISDRGICIHDEVKDLTSLHRDGWLLVSGS
jgi:hypothetical protein